ncbi:serine/threonine-protein kinase [Micromonospora carbonacea]|uniref:non-specific serine/threonine protein kinase n=1 Tax=Micromonospora carbonacea TaxID=47853 RepID=A0A1C4UU13_9ACTN|nr:serine/threonine-protein kinase [Micromonospora carbonacea]MBB5824548.1 serine/threonine-protein kinase [Micromonospora carbonacea]QLD27265.1 serine/threonine protein kinase [Micromonospora carbonacea]SCE75105.1 serine/threonine protein kinase [Micromonospora carbonacea]
MATLHAGRLLARRYRLIDQIGAGGMSVIWRARDEVLDRTVALKVLAPSLAADARFRDMVREEARSAAQLVHPHVTSVHDYGETLAPDGSITSFVVMELLAGEELEYRLTEGPLPWPEAVEIGAQVAEALAAAHRLGIVHRDITPANVMMTPVGAKVLDFGIATHVGAPDEDEDGGTFGTPAYVAPERLDGAPAQPATDIYSLGVLLYETLTGQVPYPADTWEQLGAALAGGDEPPPLEVPGLPPEVVRICLRCLSRQPRDRPTAHQVALALRDQLLPADPQAATMLAPTMTLPSIVAPPAAPPVPAGPPAPTSAPPAQAAPPGAAPAGGTPGPASSPQPAGAGSQGRPRRRWAVPVVAAGAAVAAAGALLWPRPDEQPDPMPRALPTESPAGESLGTAPTRSPSAPPTTTRPPARPRATPSAAPTTTPPAPSGGSVTEVASDIGQLIDTGVDDGGIRVDVGTDIRNLLGHAVEATGPSDLAAAVQRARDKVAERQREGSITPAYARQLDTAFQRLGAARL